MMARRGGGWAILKVPRFFGLDLKTNVTDVRDGRSLDLINVYQSGNGVVDKRPGTDSMFDADEGSTKSIDTLGTCTISGTKYWFKFTDGKFKYATSRTGAVTTISPSPAIATGVRVWYVALGGKLFFVDGTNNLRYFDGSAIADSSILSRPTVAPTGGAGTGFDYTYTVDNGLGESPASLATLVNKGSASTITIAGNYGPATLVAGQIVRIYSKATTIAAANKLVATYTWLAADVTAGNQEYRNRRHLRRSDPALHRTRARDQQDRPHRADRHHRALREARRMED
jgi:hypothetical protein